ncbi:hypothetical protein [Paenibacillus hexagrammi]|uniref:Uncharacterized protein n=1 Tax=Paenibacillus hexagrammi TaxID=2908839 RepID=A0ABY3SME3_9BACL|nr:hypothetical protein [Paenibacillus sp. YPD9-1]UJF35111.1 hypothetical protein L0M14_08240 [Paenibacillus sp. YPD9-1]
MKLQDALFNWLQMHIVVEARPDDQAAKDTLDFFAVVLNEDHAVSGMETLEDTLKITITYEQEGISKQQVFDREAAEKLLEDINSNPKYNQ